jgi:ribosome biogenesis GTPase A
MENINWYPGHMKKTRELIQENLKLVDTAIEVIDARIPVSSRNPIIDELLGNKKRIAILNKCDLADDFENKKWVETFDKRGTRAILMNCGTGEGVPKLLKILNGMRDEKNKDRERKRPLRIMVVGVPNVGKSSLINRLVGRRSAMTGDRPGITKGKQWLNLENGIQLLDTPGILWPKFEDRKTGLNLALSGAIKDEVLDRETLALELVALLQSRYPELLMGRYKLEEVKETPLENMDEIALKRGFILSGKRIDYDRVSRMLLDEFRAGIVGKITMEAVDEAGGQDERL